MGGKYLCHTFEFCCRNEPELKPPALSGGCNLLNTDLWKPHSSTQWDASRLSNSSSVFLAWEFTYSMKNHHEKPKLRSPSAFPLILHHGLYNGLKDKSSPPSAHPLPSFLLPGGLCSDLHEWNRQKRNPRAWFYWAGFKTRSKTQSSQGEPFLYHTQVVPEPSVWDDFVYLLDLSPS